MTYGHFWFKDALDASARLRLTEAFPNEPAAFEIAWRLWNDGWTGTFHELVTAARALAGGQ